MDRWRGEMRSEGWDSPMLNAIDYSLGPAFLPIKNSESMSFKAVRM